MITIIRLDYSEKQRLFHFEDNKDKAAGKDWHILLREIDQDDAMSFCNYLDKKYARNKVNGTLPTLETVKLELQLFLRQKGIRRKLD